MSVLNYKQGKELIEKKVEDFSANKHEYLSHDFHETNARSRFIDPFFQALGWDFEQTNLKFHLWDVVREYSEKTTGKRPDYAFRVNGDLKFFVEAKAPWVPLTKKEPVFQAKRYAFSTNGMAPVVILTDFEEFRVFNALKKPNMDLPMEGLLKGYDLTYDQYLTKWDHIYDHFSKEAVIDGALDELKGKLLKKTKTLDDEFLLEITAWRKMLAKNIALRNRDLTVDELNVSVQRIIDRLIFIRNLEDRQIEEDGKLLSLIQTKSDVYSKLVPVFRKLDREYNGLLFKKHFSEKLSIDDKVLIHMIKHLSWPISPYQFDVIKPEILGRIYEKFLGSKIRLTAGHHAKVEEKPEVRKAGGVYYTPEYIVDYIIKQTVGEKVKGKTPKEITKIKIVDPACGSGSFLLGAYNFLMNYHLEWYGKNKQKRRFKADWYETAEGEIRLSVQKKSDILKNNIYGVDIDREATEVASMSLYLKMLDQGFDKGQAMLFMKGHVLPDMSTNIKCGNSLIGSDYYDELSLSLFDDDNVKKVNAFDWDVEFSDVFAKGGFDCVIGNPPYVDLKGFPEKQLDYIFNFYECANNRVNLFATFIEKSFLLLNKSDGFFSMIVPTAVLAQTSYSALRKKMQDEATLIDLARLPNESFGTTAGEVKVDTLVVTWRYPHKSTVPTNLIAYRGYERIAAIDPLTAHVHGQLSITNISKAPDYIWPVNTTDIQNAITKKIEKKGVPLNTLVEFCLGLTPYDKYKGHTEKQIKEKSFHSDHQKDSTYRKLLKGNDVRRYQVSWNGEVWISYGDWLGAPREERFFTEKRILVKQIIDWSSLRIWAALTSDTLYNTQNAFNLLINDKTSLEYILGLINSKLINFYHQKRFLDEFKMRFQKILIRDCKRFPIYPIDFGNSDDELNHDRMVGHVDTILKLNKKLLKVKTEHERIVIQRQINATDQKIDSLVYKLYDLTEAEIKIVEESVN